MRNRTLYLTDEGLLKILEKTQSGMGNYADDNIIHPFKGRTIQLEKPIRVYRNLHYKKKRIYSIRQKGITVAHAERLCLSNCDFIVNEKCRQRIIKNKRKEFCAYVEGTLVGSTMGTTASRNDLPIKLVFDPYFDDAFMAKDRESYDLKVYKARGVIFEKEVRAAYIDKSEQIYKIA